MAEAQFTFGTNIDIIRAEIARALGQIIGDIDGATAKIGTSKSPTDSPFDGVVRAMARDRARVAEEVAKTQALVNQQISRTNKAETVAPLPGGSAAKQYEAAYEGGLKRLAAASEAAIKSGLDPNQARALAAREAALLNAAMAAQVKAFRDQVIKSNGVPGGSAVNGLNSLFGKTDFDRISKTAGASFAPNLVAESKQYASFFAERARLSAAQNAAERRDAQQTAAVRVAASKQELDAIKNGMTAIIAARGKVLSSASQPLLPGAQAELAKVVGQLGSIERLRGAVSRGRNDGAIFGDAPRATPASLLDPSSKFARRDDAQLAADLRYRREQNAGAARNLGGADRLPEESLRKEKELEAEIRRRKTAEGQAADAAQRVAKAGNEAADVLGTAPKTDRAALVAQDAALRAAQEAALRAEVGRAAGVVPLYNPQLSAATKQRAGGRFEARAATIARDEAAATRASFPAIDLGLGDGPRSRFDSTAIAEGAKQLQRLANQAREAKAELQALFATMDRVNRNVTVPRLTGMEGLLSAAQSQFKDLYEADERKFRQEPQLPQGGRTDYLGLRPDGQLGPRPTGVPFGPLTYRAAYGDESSVVGIRQDSIRRAAEQAEVLEMYKRRQRESEEFNRRLAGSGGGRGGSGGGGGRTGGGASSPDNPFDAFVGGLTSKGFGTGKGGPVSLNSALTGFAGTVGNAAKFGLAYAALGRLSGGFSDTVREAVDFTDSLTDVSVALGENVDSSSAFVNSLSDIARLAGENTGAALDAAARGIRAFTSSQDDASSRQDVGVDFANQAAQNAVVTNTTIKESSSDIIAIGTAFGFTADQISRVNDAIANAKGVGGDPRQISQGLANFAAVAVEAGLSAEESANIISLVQARTDQSGQAVATRLARIINTIQSAGGQQQLSAVGIDTSADLFSQLQQLSDRVQPGNVESLPDAQAKSLTARIAGTGNLRELQTLLSNIPELMSANERSARNAGAGVDEYNRKNNDLAGTLRKISGDIRVIQKEVFESGIFDIFIIGLQTAEPFLDTLGQILQTFNQLPRPIRSVVAIIGELAIGMALVRRLAAGSGAGALSRIPGIGGKPGAQADYTVPKARIGSFKNTPLVTIDEHLARVAEVRRLNPSPAQRAADEAAEAARRKPPVAATPPPSVPPRPARPFSQPPIIYGPSSLRDFDPDFDFGRQPRGLAGRSDTLSGRNFVGATARQGLTELGGAFSTLGGRIALAVGAVVVAVQTFQALSDVAKRARTALEEQRQATDALSRLDPSDPSTYGDAAQQLLEAAQARRNKSVGLFGSINEGIRGSDFFSDGRSNIDQAKDLEKIAEERQADQKVFEEQRRKAAAAGQVGTFTDVTSVDNIKLGLDALDAVGTSAAKKIELLNAAIGQLADGSDQAAGTIAPGGERAFAARVSNNVLDATGQVRFNEIVEQGNPFADKGIDDKTNALLYAQAVKNAKVGAVGRGSDAQDVIKVQEEYSRLVDDQLSKDPDKRPKLIDEAEAAKALGVTRNTPEADATLRAAENAVLGYLEEVGIGLGQGGVLSPEQIDELAAKAAAKVPVDFLPKDKQEAFREKVAEQIKRGIDNLTDPDYGKLDQITSTYFQAVIAQQAKLVEQTSRLGDPQKLVEALNRRPNIGQEISDIGGVNYAGRQQDVEALEAERNGLVDIERAAGKPVAELEAARTRLKTIKDNIAKIQSDNGEVSAQQALELLDATRNEQNAVEALTAAEAQYAIASLGPDQELSRARAELAETRRRATLLRSQGDEDGARELEARALDQVNRNNKQAADRDAAFRVSQVDPSDAVGVAQAELDNVAAARLTTDQYETDGTTTRAWLALMQREKAAQKAYLDARAARAAAARDASLDPRDALGAAQNDIQTAGQAMLDAIPGTDDFYAAEKDYKAAQKRYADIQLGYASAVAQAGVDPRDTLGQARVALEIAEAATANTLPNSQERATAIGAEAAARQNYRDQQVAYAAAVDQASVNPRNDRGVAITALKIAEDALKAALPGTIEFAERYGAVQAAKQALADVELALVSAYATASVDPLDDIGAAEAVLANAERALAGAEPNTVAYANAYGAVQQAKQALADTELNVASSAAAALVNPGDSLGAAQGAFNDAKSALAASRIGSAAYYRNLKTFREAQFALGNAEIENASAIRISKLDPRDVRGRLVEEARIARERLAAIKKNDSARLDYDAQGRVVGISPEFDALGKGIGSQVAEGLGEIDYTAIGVDKSNLLADGVASYDYVALGQSVAEQLAQGIIGGIETALNFVPGTFGGGYGGAQSQGYGSADSRSQYTGGTSFGSYTAGSARNIQDDTSATKFGTHGLLGDLLQGLDLPFGNAAHGIGTHSKNVAGTNRVSQHTLGNALDISGTPAQLERLVKELTRIKTANPEAIREIIYSPTETFLGSKGRFDPSSTTRANHQRHIHVSSTNAGALQGALQDLGISGGQAGGGYVPGSASNGGGGGLRYSADVARLQRQLNARGANLKVDGILGPATEAAYRKYGGASTKIEGVDDRARRVTVPALPRPKALAQHAQEEQQARNRSDAGIAAGEPTGGPGGRSASYDPKVAALQRRLNAKGANLKVDGIYGPKTRAAEARFGSASSSGSTGSSGGTSTEAARGQSEVSQADQAVIDYDRATAAAKRVSAVFPTSNLEQARVGLINATKELAAQQKDSLAYYQALSALKQAQQQLADAIIEAQSQARLLNIDLTDPVALAKEELRKARAKLASDKARGAPKDVLNADTNAVRQAQNAAEQAAFQQRLSDAQTAEQLGRISNAAYIRYLQSESDRLNAIKNRTRQQQDQLDTIDLALKAANQQMTGQWNIGDIKVPTPYEMRRVIKTRQAGLDYYGADPARQGRFQGPADFDPRQTTANITTTNNNIEISGADIAMIKQTLTQLLGAQTTQRTVPSTTSKKA